MARGTLGTTFLRPPGFAGRVATLALLLLAGPVHPGDWPQFRGPNGRGVADETGLPEHWGPAENVRWKSELPGPGVSSPIVVGGQVYVTACSGPDYNRLHVLVFDATTGGRLWHRQFWGTGNTLCHDKTNMAAPTPAADGERVYALFGTGDLACFDRHGDLIWYRALARDYPGLTNQLGLAASPVLAGGVLLLPLDNPGDSFALAVDPRTGENRWKAPRPRNLGWASPLVVDRGGRAEAVLASVGQLTAYDADTGRRLWELADAGLCPDPCVPTPAYGEGLLVAAGGAALRLGEGSSPPAVAWKSARLRPAYASPLVYQGRLYAVNNSAILLQCLDLADGKPLWQQRLKGPFSASPVAADGKIYLVNEDGLATVIEAGEKPRVLGTGTVGEPVLATPAVAGGALFLRSARHLYCIARRPTP